MPSSKKLKLNSIIYVNFAPYENAGGILDYFKSNFKYMALFCYNFHNLGKKGKYSKLRVYLKGKKIDTKNLLDFKVPEQFIFLFLPFRSLFIFIQIALYTLYLTYEYGEFEIYFTVNAFTAWIGNILKKVGLVNKTIFWVYDYYPPFHKSKIIVFMRSLYWQFDKWATKSDMLIFLSSRVAKLRKDIGVLSNKDKYKIIPVGTTQIVSLKHIKLNINSKIKIVFLGVIKKNQGLDLVFDSSKKLIKTFPKIQIDVIGAGPDLKYFKSRGIKSKLNINFHGYLPDIDINKIVTHAHIGIAPYIPSSENEAFYGDPSKIKKYLSFGLPTITTNVFEFSKEIRSTNAGILINYKQDDFVRAIEKVVKNYKFYRNGATKLCRKYYYKNLYPEMFTKY